MDEIEIKHGEVEEISAEHEPSTKGFFTLGNIALLASIVMVAAVFAMMLMSQSKSQPTEGPAPDFEVKTFDGETFKLSDFKGNIVVLNFWAGWCGPCRDEAPALQATWEKYRDQGVIFLGVAYADNGPSSLAFIEEYGITYYNGPDLETRISEVYNIQGVPETFIIDRDGNIQDFFYAPISERELSSKIEQLLQ